MGEPVGLATGADAEVTADAEEAGGADALAAGGALVDAAAVVLAAVGALDDGVADFDFDELQPARKSAVAEIAAIDASGIGRRKRDACNRLCETIESLHEGCGW
jgi:hypothetical protein